MKLLVMCEGSNEKAVTDKLPVPADYQGRIKRTRKFCTKPEIEMLLIIAEGKDAEFEKVKAGKRKMKAKDFCKANVVYNHKRYDNSTNFYKDYFGSNIETLVAVIKKYRQTHGAHTALDSTLYKIRRAIQTVPCLQILLLLAEDAIFPSELCKRKTKPRKKAAISAAAHRDGGQLFLRHITFFRGICGKQLFSPCFISFAQLRRVLQEP